MEGSEVSQIPKKELSLKQNQSLAQTNTSIDNSREYLQTLIDSKSIPPYIKTVEMAFLVAEYGRARGFEAIDAFHFITPVNGILSVNAKGSGQLLFQNKYVIKEIHRAAYIYAAHGKEFISPRLLAVDEVMWALGINNEEFVEFDEAKKARISTARDRITEIHYGFRGNDGKVVWEGEFKYYYSQINAELLAKSTYQNYLPDMMLHRAKVGLSKVLGVLTGSDSEEVASLGNSNYIDIVEGEVTVMP